MTPESLLEKLDQLTDESTAISHLRELVLQFAVRGRLTQQDPFESVDAQIRIANGFRDSLQRPKTDEPLQAPFNIPENWGWIAIGNAMKLINGRAFKPEEWTVQGTPIIRIQNLNDRNASFNRSTLSLDRKVHVNDGDLLISWSGTPGTSFGAFIWDRGFAYLNQHIFRCELVEGVFEKTYLRFAVNARLDEMISQAHGGVGLRHITKGNLESILLPLPPLPEQMRIVAKLDELLALCDRLEAQQKEREERHVAISRAAIARFDESPTPANLSLLFHHSYSVTPADLRKTILNLAVRGKLAPQDPNDEPVAEMVERIRAERGRSGSKNSSGAATHSSDPDLGFDIPDSWTWQRLESILIFGPTNGVSPKGVDHETPVKSLTLSATTSGRFKREHSKFVEIDVPSNSDLWLRDGDILVQRGNTLEYVGVPAVYRGESNQFIYPDLMMKLRVSSVVDVDFMHLVMLSEPSREYLRKRASGTSGSMPKINHSTLKGLPIPLPPVVEQRRIVHTVKRLFGMVDQLESFLAASQVKSRELLDAVVHQLLYASSQAVDIPANSNNRTAIRAAVLCYVVQRLAQNSHFGRTMNMKIGYMAETHLGLSLGWQPERQAAGPWDPWIGEFDAMGRREGWFTVTERSLGNSHTKYDYTPKAALKEKAAEAVSVLGRQKGEFDRMLSLFADRSTEEAEIISTLFAAWNDFLIDGKSPSDDDIIREVRENWHVSKQRFTPSRLATWLKWMRDNRLVPQGRPPRTRQQFSLPLN